MSLNIKNGDQLIPVAGTPKVTKSSLELDKVENKTSAEIRDELTLDNVKNAMGDAYLDKTELSYITGLTRKNLLSLAKVSKTETGTVKFVVSAFDGTIRAVGTAGTSSSILEIKNAVVNEPVIISTGNSEASESGCYMDVYDSDWKNRTVVADTEVSRNKVGIIRVIVASNSTVDITLKPMVRKASITDSTFEPYRVSLQEQVDDSKTNLLSTIVASSNASATNAKVLDFQGTGKAVEKLVVEGKTSQDGTPTPSAPAEVKGVGDKTKNLFPLDKATVTASGGGYAIGSNTAHYPFKLATGTYIISYTQTATSGQTQFSFYDSSDTTKNIDKTITNTASVSVEVTATAPIESFTLFSNKPTEITNFMIRKSTDSAGYEPYGKYKIPISVAGKTSNIYLDAPLLDGDVLDTETGIITRADKTKETFEAPEIATTVGKNTLSVDTEIIPSKVEVTSFGEYYSKTQIDKMLAEIKAMIPSATALSEDSED